MQVGEVPSASPTINEYVAHFAHKLIDAPPATDEHLISWRNYAFSIALAAGQAANRGNLVTSELLNELFNQELVEAAAAKGLPRIPEVATMELTIIEWRLHWRRILHDLEMGRAEPQTEADFLGALAAGEITYQSVISQ